MQSAQSRLGSKAMSIENVTTALQVNATTGNGVTTLVLPEPRLVTFKITGNGTVTGGAITILAIRPEDRKGWSRRPREF
jgi:hypothetical protein